MTDNEALERVLEVYRPLWYVEYAVPEIVPGLGTDKELGQLDALYNKHQAFMAKLSTNANLLQHLKQGLKADVTVDDPANELDKEIEEALLNRAEFATCQLSRAIVMEPHLLQVMDREEKKRIVHDVYQELCQSMELLEAWGSKIALDALEGYMHFYGEGVQLGKMADVDLLGKEEEGQGSSDA